MKHRIMVVDDSKVTYVAMKNMLDGTDIEIAQHCRSGEEALEAYPSVKPDLVTMDIVMPGMDGLETARLLLEQWPNAHILMVSALAYDDTMHTADAIGVKGFLFKPLEKEPLLQRIYEVLSQSEAGTGTGGNLA